MVENPTEMNWRSMSQTGTHVVVSRDPPYPLELYSLSHMSEPQLLTEMRRKMDEMEAAVVDVLISRSGKENCRRCS